MANKGNDRDMPARPDEESRPFADDESIRGVGDPNDEEFDAADLEDTGDDTDEEEEDDGSF